MYLFCCSKVLKALTRAKNRGFSDVLYLDSVNKKNLEEVSSCNIFVVKVCFKQIYLLILDYKINYHILSL